MRKLIVCLLVVMSINVLIPNRLGDLYNFDAHKPPKKYYFDKLLYMPLETEYENITL